MFNLFKSSFLSKQRQHNMTTINFNSKRSSPGDYSELSNFYGGAEFEYMAQRFSQSEITHLFDHLETCDNEEFWRWLQILNPKGTQKKPVTQGQMDFWFTKGGLKNGIPIRGIAAQLLGTMVRSGPAAQKRRKAVAKELGLDTIKVNDELTDDEKKAWMKICLQHKYADPHFRDLLLSTGNATLHEIPLRGLGENNNWTYKVFKGKSYGKDWLGRLLREIRDEWKQEQSAEPAAKKQRTAQYRQYVV